MCGHIAPPNSKCKVISNEFLCHNQSFQYPRDNSGQAGRERQQPTESWGRSLGKEYGVASGGKDSSSAVMVPGNYSPAFPPKSHNPSFVPVALKKYILKEVIKGFIWLTIPDHSPSLQRSQGSENLKQLGT